MDTTNLSDIATNVESGSMEPVDDNNVDIVPTTSFPIADDNVDGNNNSTVDSIRAQREKIQKFFKTYWFPSIIIILIISCCILFVTYLFTVDSKPLKPYNKTLRYQNETFGDTSNIIDASGIKSDIMDHIEQIPEDPVDISDKKDLKEIKEHLEEVKDTIDNAIDEIKDIDEIEDIDNVNVNDVNDIEQSEQSEQSGDEDIESAPESISPDDLEMSPMQASFPIELIEE